MNKKHISIRIDAELLERIQQLIKKSNGYVNMTALLENGAKKEIAELEKVFGNNKGGK